MISYRFVFIFSLFIGAFLASCTPAGQPTPTLDAVFGSSSGNPELTLELSKNTYKSGEPITGMLTLRNAGESEILVNGRMAPNEQTAPERLRDIVFSIRGPVGEFLIPKILINMRAPRDTDFVLLTPGESIEKEIGLDEIYAFAQPGTYSVQAIYLNVSDPEVAVAWKGQLSSNVVTIRLED